MVNSSNIEFFLFERYEGNLSEKEEIALQEFLKTNPKFKEDEKAWKLSYVVKEKVVLSKTSQLLKRHAIFSLRWKWLKLTVLLIALITPIYFIFINPKENINCSNNVYESNVVTNYKIGDTAKIVSTSVRSTVNSVTNVVIDPKLKNLKLLQSKVKPELQLKKVVTLESLILKKTDSEKKQKVNDQLPAIVEPKLVQQEQINWPNENKSLPESSIDTSESNKTFPEEISTIETTAEDTIINLKLPVKEKANGSSKKKKNRTKFKLRINRFGDKINIVPIETDY